jgi:hypothetical protein
VKRPTTILLVLAALSAAPLLRAQPAPHVDAEAEARKHFERADAFRDKEEWREALREYRQSLTFKKTKGAMASAAVCLRALGQYDEALDQYEELRREFPALPAAMEAKVAPAMAELQRLVGTLVVSGEGLDGATLFVDERRRGTLPATARLRLAVGNHTLRVEKEGFEPIVATGVPVKPSQDNVVVLSPKSKQGRLRVTEKHNRVLDVEVDGAVVGKTPWEGSVAAGDHVVRVHGFVRLDADEDLEATHAVGTPVDRTEMGSDKSTVAVRLFQLSAVALAAIDLDGALRVEATPEEAAIAVDGNVLGHGAWEGRLPLGVHTLEIRASGFSTTRQELHLERRKQPQIRVHLAHAPRLGTWGPKRNAAVGVTYALGAAGITVGAITGAAALVTISGVRTHCEVPLCPASQTSATNRALVLANASTVGLSVGAAGLVTGTLLALLYRPYDVRPGRETGQRPTRPSVSIRAGVGLGQLDLEGRF